MRELLRAGCELLSENRNAISNGFKWDMDMMSIAGSVIFTSAGKTADVEKMKECKKILKKHEGVFSSFRSNMEIPVVSKMSLSDDPEGYLLKLLSIYETLKDAKLSGSEYVAMAALAICDESRVADYELIASNTKALMKKMSSIHPFLTDREDTAFAALLAASGKDFDQIIEETEDCYELLKTKFPFHNNALQSLSHVLTLMPGNPGDKCEKVFEIYDALRARGVAYGKDYELASLGALVTAEMSAEELACEIADASAFLKACKGFGDWSLGQKTRSMFAALLAAQAYAPCSTVMDASVINSSLAMVIAEELCLMLTVMMVSTMSTTN